MSITRSYNKYTDTYYAYDTSYVWDEKAQKKVQQKKCIGKYDPDTGEIIPTGKRGRPSKQIIKKESSDIQSSQAPDMSELISRAENLNRTLDTIGSLIEKAAEDITELRESVDGLMHQLRAEK